MARKGIKLRRSSGARIEGKTKSDLGHMPDARRSSEDIKEAQINDKDHTDKEHTKGQSGKTKVESDKKSHVAGKKDRNIEMLKGVNQDVQSPKTMGNGGTGDSNNEIVGDASNSDVKGETKHVTVTKDAASTKAEEERLAAAAAKAEEEKLMAVAAAAAKAEEKRLAAEAAAVTHALNKEDMNSGRSIYRSSLITSSWTIQPPRDDVDKVLK